jgi:hypothetical protein
VIRRAQGWPKVIDVMVLVKPATVVAWHRKGFRSYSHWRSRRPGRPRINAEIRDLIRIMSNANPCGVRRAFMGSCSSHVERSVRISSHYALLFALPQGLWDLSCQCDFRHRSPNPVAVEQPQGFVQPPPTPPLPAEALSVLSPPHMAPRKGQAAALVEHWLMTNPAPAADDQLLTPQPARLCNHHEAKSCRK